MFNFFKKKPIDRVNDKTYLEETSGKEEIAEKVIEQSKEDLELKEKKERLNRLISKLSSLTERIELIERKIDRIENRLGIKNE